MSDAQGEVIFFSTTNYCLFFLFNRASQDPLRFPTPPALYLGWPLLPTWTLLGRKSLQHSLNTQAY